MLEEMLIVTSVICGLILLAFICVYIYQEELSKEQNFKEWQREKCIKEGIDFDTSVHIAVVGESASGKSSLINGIRGIPDDHVDAAPTGNIETTHVTKPYKVGEMAFWDCPGAYTPNFPGKNYINYLKIFKFDIVCLLTSGKRSGPKNNIMVSDMENDIISGSYDSGKHLFIVHSKSDKGFGDLRQIMPSYRSGRKNVYKQNREREFISKISRPELKDKFDHYFVSSSVMRHCAKKLKQIDTTTAEIEDAEINMLDEYNLETALLRLSSGILKNKTSSTPINNAPLSINENSFG